MSDDTQATTAEPTDALLEHLTEPQRQAVTHVEGPLLVLAAAGSGKTRVITRRIAYLIQRVGIAPWNILGITFTNKAAAEMRQRVERLVTERQASAVTLSTFHSLCARLIRQYADRLNLPPGYSIYDRSDQTRAMKQSLEALKINASNFPPGKVLASISNAKNELIDADAYAASANEFYTRSVAGIYKQYQKTLAKNHALDFDDLMMRTVDLLRQHPDVVAELRERYQYLMIDEYQDTNHAQFVIANTLAAEHKNICATGDPDQSIYGWRGANIRNILEFETHYPNAAVVRLEQNYRSTQSILAVADALIQCNTQRKHKALWTENDPGEPVTVVTCQDESNEAQWIVDWLSKLHNDQDLPWGGMAVFYRVNSLSRSIEDALRSNSIPYQVARGTAFYDRKEIKDTVGYLRVIANPADEVSLLRIINAPARGISITSVKALQAHAVANDVTIAALLADTTQLPALNTRAVTSIKKFHQALTGWMPENVEAAADSDNADAPSLRGLVERVIRESGLEGHYRNDKSDPDEERLMNLGELVSSAQQFEDQFVDPLAPDQVPTLARKLQGYLEQISLVSDIDSVDDTQGAVTLMTLHAAKGLEFPAVAMLGVEDGLLPHSRAFTDLPEMEEERRLCFVGITRTQQRLAITHTRYRSVFGQIKPSLPSRFLEELPGDHIEKLDNTEGDDAPFHHDGDDENADPDGLPPGTLVRHPTFGLGRVINVRPVAAQTRAQVEFSEVGVKTLILQYAQLEKIPT